MCFHQRQSAFIGGHWYFLTFSASGFPRQQAHREKSPGEPAEHLAVGLQPGGVSSKVR
jgi:hypothetical protein